MDARDIIIRPVITEHSYDGMEYGVYTFEVAKEANKIEIAKAVEELFDVKVVKVNTMNVKAKPKRYRYQTKGYTKTWKKAMVTVADGQSIELFAQ
jgi:large subunit ribosomal protein L23